MITEILDLTQFNVQSLSHKCETKPTHYILYGYDTTPRMGTIETKPHSRRVSGFFGWGSEEACKAAIEYINSVNQPTVEIK